MAENGRQQTTLFSKTAIMTAMSAAGLQHTRGMPKAEELQQTRLVQTAWPCDKPNSGQGVELGHSLY